MRRSRALCCALSPDPGGALQVGETHLLLYVAFEDDVVVNDSDHAIEDDGRPLGADAADAAGTGRRGSGRLCAQAAAAQNTARAMAMLTAGLRTNQTHCRPRS